MRHNFPSLALPRCGLADLYAREGIQSKARQEFERLAVDDFAAIPRDWNWIFGLATLSGVCAFLRDERRGAILYELLRPYAGRNVTIGWGDVSYGSVDYYLGRLAVLMGRLDEAESHFVLALRFNERMGARPLVAHTQFEYGLALLARAWDRDRERALQLLRRALDTALELGMKGLEGRARALIAETLKPDGPTGVPTAERVGTDPQRAIATVLFTDLVGSTERISEMKDRRWVELLQRFQQMQLEELARFQGRRILTAGDDMLAVFHHPAEAIRCALRIAASAEQIGLQVRAGIHTGECEFVGDDVAGIAVHIGARVAARAGAGEVIVSSTVRDLLAGGDMVFNDLGLATLKGIPGEWRLYAVQRPEL